MQTKPLFTSGGDRATEAWIERLHWHSDSLWSIYVTGYKSAADHLVGCMAKSRSERETLFFPILFLYRHYLEICFKDTIIGGNRLLKADQKPPHGHTLSPLWEIAKDIACKVWPCEPTPSEFSKIDRIVHEFDRIDHSAQSFRYPFDTEGQKLLLPDDALSINIGNLAKEINDVVPILEGLSFGISDRLEGVSDGCR